jgi:hypothetical protein
MGPSPEIAEPSTSKEHPNPTPWLLGRDHGLAGKLKPIGSQHNIQFCSRRFRKTWRKLDITAMLANDLMLIRLRFYFRHVIL